MRKEFVLGMEALLIPNALQQFDKDNTIIIPMATIEELQSYNGYTEEVKNAQKVLEYITDLGINRLVGEGVKQKNGSLLKVAVDQEIDFSNDDLRLLINLSKYDKRRLKVCKYLQKDANERNVKKVILISMNPITRIKAPLVGVRAEEPKFRLFPKLVDQYKGHVYAMVKQDVIEQLYTNGYIDVEQLINHRELGLFPNMFLTIKDQTGSRTALGVYRKGKIWLIEKNKLNLPHNFHPMKKTQNFLLYALDALPDDIPYVIVKGPAGTGKTFCSLLMGLSQTNRISRKKPVYGRVLVSAPMLDEKVKKIGAVKGGLEEKLNPYTAGILDNANEIFAFNKYLKYHGEQHFEQNKKGKGEKRDVEHVQVEEYDQLRAVMNDGLFRIVSLDLLRGRTFTNSFYIIDEAQNIRPDDMKTILTRLGQGSKMIFLGDPSQTDAIGMNEQYNGLTYISEKFKGSELCAQITFDDNETVRSEAVKEALRIFN